VTAGTNFDALGFDVAAHHRQTGDVAPRPREALHEPVGNRIVEDREYDRGLRACREQGAQRLRPRSDDHIKVSSSEFGSKLLDPFNATLAPKIIDRDVLAFDKTVFEKARLELLDLTRVQSRGAQPAQIGNTSYLSGCRLLLRARRERPRRSTGGAVMNSRRFTDCPSQPRTRP
jgi:hypothetical protein